MKTIVVLNSKGGVGKSNITRHLAVAAEMENAGTVVLCDTDPQSSLADWWNARPSETPPLAVVGVTEFSSKQPVLASRFHYLFFDTAAADAEQYAEVLRSADLIVIPVVPSPDDVRSLNRLTLPVVKKKWKAIYFRIKQGTARNATSDFHYGCTLGTWDRLPNYYSATGRLCKSRLCRFDNVRG